MHFARPLTLQYWVVGFISFVGVIAPTPALATSVAIPIHKIEAPAVDLITREGKPLDRDQATDLARKGKDLSELNPRTNDVWNPKLAAESPTYFKPILPECPTEGVTYDSAMSSAGGLFRNRVIAIDQGQRVPLLLEMSLQSHAALTRAALLQKLGYLLPTPLHCPALKVKFASPADRKSFLDELSDQTLTARTRWIHAPAGGPTADDQANDEKTSEVVLQDVILESAQIEIPPYLWGILPPTHLKGRRAVRALFVPLVLLDIPEAINLYAWEMGKTFNDSVLLTHPFAESFAEVTFPDLRWAVRRMAKLTRQDWEEIIAAGKYPEDISVLLVEKAIARRNHALDLFEFPNEKRLAINPNISFGAIKNGKLTQEYYDGYAARFSYGNPLAPLRTGEIFRYFLLKGIGEGLSAATGAITRNFLQLQTVNDLAAQNQKRQFEDFLKFADKNPGKPYRMPISVWGGPTAGFSFDASRNVVTGTYFGSDAGVQLVDQLAFRADVGLFLGMNGIKDIVPTAGANVAVQRSYLHVRPVTSMKAALKTNWLDIIVPSFMKGLSNLAVLKSGASDEEAKAQYEKFNDELKQGEMIVVTDSVLFNAQLGVAVPIPLFPDPTLVDFNPTFGVTGSYQPVVLKRTTIVKTDKGIQVYIQSADHQTLQVEFNFNWYVNLLRLSTATKWGTGNTDAFLLDRDPQVATKYRPFLSGMRALILHNNDEILDQEFRNYTLAHKIKASIQKMKLIWMRWTWMEETHKVEVTPPDHPEAKRTLMSIKSLKRQSSELFSILSDIAGTLSDGSVQLGGLASAETAISPMGSIIWSATTTEGEITPGTNNDPVTIFESHWTGARMGRAKVLQLLDYLEDRVRPLNLDRPLIRKEEFQQMSSLQLYDIAQTLIVYEKGVQNVRNFLYPKGGISEVVDRLIDIEGRAEMDRWCSTIAERLLNEPFQQKFYYSREDGQSLSFRCLKPWMVSVLELRHDSKSKPDLAGQARIRWTSKLLTKLRSSLKLSTFLTIVGKEGHFFQIKVSGFRSQDENGDVEYVSDTLGQYDQEAGAGPFRDLISRYGISSHEMYAQYLTEGY